MSVRWILYPSFSALRTCSLRIWQNISMYAFFHLAFFSAANPWRNISLDSWNDVTIFSDNLKHECSKIVLRPFSYTTVPTGPNLTPKRTPKADPGFALGPLRVRFSKICVRFGSARGSLWVRFGSARADLKWNFL